MLWPTQGVKGRIFHNSGLSNEETVISASVVPFCEPTSKNLWPLRCAEYVPMMTGTESCISACTLRITNRELFWRLCTAPKNVFYLAVTQTLFLSLICQPTSKDINPHMSKHYLFLWNVNFFFRERLLSTHTHTHTHTHTKCFRWEKQLFRKRKAKSIRAILRDLE